MDKERTTQAPDVANAYQVHLSTEIFDGLLAEATDVRSVAQRVASGKCELEADGAVNGRGQCWIAGPGIRLRDFHHGLGREIARMFAADESEVFATRSAYLYYDARDFSFFHHDAVHAHVTVIVGLSDRLLPLLTFPNFVGVTAEDVARLNAINTAYGHDFAGQISHQFGPRAIAYPVEIPRQHAVAIRGRRVPHLRPAQPIAGMVCTVCYSFLKPSQGWIIE